ncbi:MAG: hypothetical protein N3G21_07310 [Candidatus Hydrogenedentes bacterium]|nr:hypothetical protein [Candidatus Hydrogenedentota bacterium]
MNKICRLALAFLFVEGSVLLVLVSYAQEVTESKITDRSNLWERSGENVLQGFKNMYNFHVIYEPESNDYPYRAWFFGWAVKDCNRNIEGFSGCDAIFTARAKDLEGPWEVYCGDDIWDRSGDPERWKPLFAPLGTYFDKWHNGDPSVIKVGDKYYMAYSATGHDKDGIPDGREGDTDGDFYCIMGAVSTDGINWERSKNPILVYENEFGRKEKEGDVVLYGTYHRPSIMYEGGKFKMWFDYWAPWGISMGYAENEKDFLKMEDWKLVRYGDNPCLKEFPNPDVVKVGNVYYAFSDSGGYEPHEWKGRKITEAVSLDGLDWKILGFVQPDNDAPAIHVPEAITHNEGGKVWLYVFYACQRGGDTNYDFRYDRIRVMRREISEDVKQMLEKGMK